MSFDLPGDDETLFDEPVDSLTFEKMIILDLVYLQPGGGIRFAHPFYCGGIRYVRGRRPRLLSQRLRS